MGRVRGSILRVYKNMTPVERGIVSPAAVPVNDGCQIQEFVLHRDVGDVDRPRLVWTCYIGIPKQIQDHSRTLQTGNAGRKTLKKHNAEGKRF